ncbi:MAG: hypothetical protein FJ029_05905 [Actinobacteria bacterium]|nr:hypothetical protein [Actinomycetota bacterium]
MGNPCRTTTRPRAAKTLGVAGLGDVGQALAARAQGFGMRVIALCRRAPLPHPGDGARGGGSPGEDAVPTVFGPDHLAEFLAQADFVVNLLPLTSATRALFGAPEFGRMKPSAYFLNLGRGETVDQDALIAALRAGAIAGAGLDVTAPEPLPPESPLWEMPNVILTAHYAGWSDAMLDRIFAIFIDNLVRFDAGQPLHNVVDLRAGY